MITDYEKNVLKARIKRAKETNNPQVLISLAQQDRILTALGKNTRSEEFVKVDVDQLERQLILIDALAKDTNPNVK